VSWAKGELILGKKKKHLLVETGKLDEDEKFITENAFYSLKVRKYDFSNNTIFFSLVIV